MTSRVGLSERDRSAFVVDGPFDDLQNTVVSAIEANVPFIEVQNGNGKMRSINPRLITSLEETDDESLTPGEKEVLAAVRQRLGETYASCNPERALGRGSKKASGPESVSPGPPITMEGKPEIGLRDPP